MVDGNTAYTVTKNVYALSRRLLVMPRPRPLMVSSYARKYKCWYTIITMYGSNNHATPKLICSPEIHTTVRGRHKSANAPHFFGHSAVKGNNKEIIKTLHYWALRWEFRAQNAKSMSIPCRHCDFHTSTITGIQRGEVFEYHLNYK